MAEYTKCRGCGRQYIPNSATFQYLRHATRRRRSKDGSTRMERKCNSCTLHDWGQEMASEYLEVVQRVLNDMSRV